MRWPCCLFGLLLCAPLHAQGWVTAPPKSVQIDPSGKAQIQADGSILVPPAEGLRRYRLECIVNQDSIGALRIEVLPHASLPGKGPGHGAKGNFALTELRVRSTMGRSSRWVELVNPTSSAAAVGWSASAAVDAQEGTGWSPGAPSGAQEIVFQLADPLKKGRRTLVLDLEFHTGGSRSLGCFRVSISGDKNASAAGAEAKWGQTQNAINKAIDKGVAYLLAQQYLDGSWSGHTNRATGATALVAYALLKSGVSKDHQAVRRVLTYIAARPPRFTYEAGTQLMAFAAADKQRWKDHAASIVDELLDWQIGDWGYPGGRDLSNTQYGALGLWAGLQMGIEVPRPAWERLVDGVLLYQTGDGGFGYRPGNVGTGSMSGAGVSVLTLSLPHLSGAMEKKARTAQRRGLDWLDRNFSPTTNTGSGGWFHYYLYGIERVGAFAEVETLNGQNWYREGARQLLKQQKGNGSWGDDPTTTSFCLLFLNRASAPKSGPDGGRTVVLYGKDDPTHNVSLRAAGDSPMTIWVSSFGEKLLEGYTYEGEENEGLRVERVEYLTEGGVILGDSREGGAEWIYNTRDPKAGWAQTTFEAKGWKKGAMAFGRKDSPQMAVATEWKTPEIWLRKELEVQLQDLIDPQLEFNFSARAAEGGGVRGNLLKLYDDEEEFPGRLTEGTGAALDSLGDAQNGERFLRVTPRQSYKERISGWGFPIRAKPEEGEYRYLQFAWRKPGNVMIQLSMDGTWGKGVRYFAGQNQIAFNPAIQVTEKPPERWTVVTRDLWKDLGRDALLTGLALTPMDDAGAEFDAFYLARSRGDFKHRRTMVNEEPEWIAVGDGGPRPAEEGAFLLFINGKEVFSGNWETGGFEPLMSASEFKNHLSPGRNVLAIHAKNSELGRALDVSLKDVKRLASISGDPTRARRGARYATRVAFPRPGKYRVWARVHVMDEILGISVPFDSDPLHLTVTSALDPKMLSYATDGLRNLLAGGVESVVASSERGGSPAKHAVDNTQQLAWLCANGDAAPEIEITLARPVRADLLLLSHARTGLPTRVEVTLNGRGKPISATLSRDRLIKTEIHLGRPQKIRSVRVRIVRHSEGPVPSLKAVGFAEVELQLGGKR